jgi:hypothetical protein
MSVVAIYADPCSDDSLLARKRVPSRMPSAPSHNAAVAGCTRQTPT